MVIKLKYVFIYLIRIYQSLPLSSHGYCRYYPTCSDYTIAALKKYGAVKGLYLGIKRILRCNIGGSHGCDFLLTPSEKNN